MQLISFLEKLLLEILLPDVIESGGCSAVDKSFGVNDIRDMSLVVLMFLKQLREISRVRSSIASGHKL